MLILPFLTLYPGLMEGGYIPVNPATRSGSKRPLIGAKRRRMVITLLFGRKESRGERCFRMDSPHSSSR